MAAGARAHVAIREEKLAAAVHAALCKLSFTTAAVSVRQNSTAVRHFVFELALVAGAAGVQQCAFALPAPVYKFPLVLNTNREEQSAVALPVSVAVFTVIAIAVSAPSHGAQLAQARVRPRQRALWGARLARFCPKLI